jgi:iron complex transport system ATP-binding protein
MIKCTSLSAARGGSSLINEFSFEFISGVYVIKGANGSGKSTFLLSLLGEVPLAAGRVEINGRDLSALSAVERSAAFSWYEDQEIAFNFTVKDVLEWGGWRAGMSDNLSAEELSPREWKKLSRGERARVLLTSVLARESDHILLDEPAAGLDDAMVSRLASSLSSKVSVGATVIISEHDHRLISALDAQELLIHDGSLILQPRK